MFMWGSMGWEQPTIHIGGCPENRVGGALATFFGQRIGLPEEFHGQPGIAEKMPSVKLGPASYTPKGLFHQRKCCL